MHRRALVAAAALWPFWARRCGGQPATPQEAGVLVEAWRRGMVDAGWVEGRNLAIEYRWAESDLSRQPRLIAELIGARVDVLVLAGSSAARAARQATSTVPIVVTALGDPVELGLVAALARRGANLTGLAWQSRTS
jgi:putative ABC transport system substrate-binding protein